MKSSRKKTFTDETGQEASRYCVNSNELSNCWVISKRILLALCWGLETSPFPDEARFSGWGPRVGRGGGGIRLNLARRCCAAFPNTHTHTHAHTHTGQTGSVGKVIPEPASIFPSSVRLRHIRPCLLSLLEHSSFPEGSTLSEKREQGE